MAGAVQTEAARAEEIPVLVDSHCHLGFPGLKEDLEGVVARARNAGVETLLAIDTRLEALSELIPLLDCYSNIFCSVGVHPHDAEMAPETDALVTALRDGAGHPKVVGIGETGLDYYYDNAPRSAQRRSFEAHVMAAQDCSLPIIVHTRDAEDDTYEILRAGMAERPFSGVIHCFTASQDFAEKALGLGLYISLSGIVTFKNARELQETARRIPLERLLVETDAPYLAPVPHRGKRCEPAYVADTARFVAGLRGLDLADLAQATTDNFFTLFAKAAA